jgi:hypothetical protein
VKDGYRFVDGGGDLFDDLPGVSFGIMEYENGEGWEIIQSF